MRVLVLLIYYLFPMFSSTARALVNPIFRKLPKQFTTVRHVGNSMSGGPTIVSVCEEKIQKALEAESVQVTGM